MRNPLQDQLLKAGLAKKSSLAQIVREQTRQKQDKSAAPVAGSVDARQLQAQRVDRDRALAAERNAQARGNELSAQVRQIVEAHKVQRDGEVEYRFADGNKIRSLGVNAVLRAQLAGGALVVVRSGSDYELLPRAAADKVRERDPDVIVVDHRYSAGVAELNADDEYYRRFQVPDDLSW